MHGPYSFRFILSLSLFALLQGCGDIIHVYEYTDVLDVELSLVKDGERYNFNNDNLTALLKPNEELLSISLQEIEIQTWEFCYDDPGEFDFNVNFVDYYDEFTMDDQLGDVDAEWAISIKVDDSENLNGSEFVDDGDHGKETFRCSANVFKGRGSFYDYIEELFEVITEKVEKEISSNKESAYLRIYNQDTQDISKVHFENVKITCSLNAFRKVWFSYNVNVHYLDYGDVLEYCTLSADIKL